MEAEEQDIIEVDKSIIDGEYYTIKDGKVKNNNRHLKSYCNPKSIAESNSARVWEHEGKYYIVPGSCGESLTVVEVVPLIPDMPSLTYEERNLVQNWIEGWIEDIDDDLAERAQKVEDYFSTDISRGGYNGQLIKAKNRMFVCNGRKVNVVAKKHGNQIQEAFSFAEPAQLQL